MARTWLVQELGSMSGSTSVIKGFSEKTLEPGFVHQVWQKVSAYVGFVTLIIGHRVRVLEQLFNEENSDLYRAFLTYYATQAAPAQGGTGYVSAGQLQTVARALQAFVLWYCNTGKRSGRLLTTTPLTLSELCRAASSQLTVLNRTFDEDSHPALRDPVATELQLVNALIDGIKALVEKRDQFGPQRLYNGRPTHRERRRLQQLAWEAHDLLLATLQSALACATRPSVLARLCWEGTPCLTNGCFTGGCPGTIIKLEPNNKVHITSAHHKNATSGQTRDLIDFVFTSGPFVYCFVFSSAHCTCF